jgi:hypothetical protein
MKKAVQRFAESSVTRGKFPVPVKTPMKSRPDYAVTGEYVGGAYEMVMHEQRQEGDVLKPHGVPPACVHPQPLGRDVLDPGGPRVLPVSQRAEHGSQLSRQEEFERGLRQDGATMAWSYGELGFHDRRIDGRRYRGTNSDELLGPQRPYKTKGWQADIPLEKYWTIV